ncbi:hypothetical protein LAD77_00160 [Klebsiella pneumoniae]|nr:hypothetical protein [Klebsiella pneumoniae]
MIGDDSTIDFSKYLSTLSLAGPARLRQSGFPYSRYGRTFPTRWWWCTDRRPSGQVADAAAALGASVRQTVWRRLICNYRRCRNQIKNKDADSAADRRDPVALRTTPNQPARRGDKSW